MDHGFLDYNLPYFGKQADGNNNLSKDTEEGYFTNVYFTNIYK